MYFSEAYNIKYSEDRDWVDHSLQGDTALFIDPVLLLKTKHPYLMDSQNKIKEFFQNAFEKIAKVRGKGELALKSVEELFRFKEPKETLLGYTISGGAGRGLGPDFSRKLRDTIVDFMDMGIEDLSENLAIFNLLVEGIGQDGISDMITNIIKKDLVKYTQHVCLKENVPMKEFIVENLGYDYENDMWDSGREKLPLNKYDKKTSVILVPKDILRTDEIVNVEDFEYYLSSIDNNELRGKATKIFTSNLNISKIKSATKNNPHDAKLIFEDYFNLLKNTKHEASDFRDRQLFYKFNKFMKNIGSEIPLKATDKSDEESLVSFVEAVINQYKRIVEKRQGWELFFDENDKIKPERIMQILFWDIADTMVQLNGKISVHAESQTGRGPVDFKFTEGFDKKIVVEIKKIKSPEFYSGYFKQLPTYMESDDAVKGYYVAIKLEDSDSARFQNLLRKLEDNLDGIDKKIKPNMKPIEIDGRIKKTASKIK